MRTLYVVFRADNPARLGPRIKDAFGPDNYLEVGTGQWLVVGEGTAKDISDKLGITEGGISNAMVVATNGYFGRAPANIWEWVAARLKVTSNG